VGVSHYLPTGDLANSSTRARSDWKWVPYGYVPWAWKFRPGKQACTDFGYEGTPEKSSGERSGRRVRPTVMKQRPGVFLPPRGEILLWLSIPTPREALKSTVCLRDCP
jgi:hypothetical protein